MRTATFNAILVSLVAAVFAFTSPANAAITAFTSFENEPVTEAAYTDTGDGNADHDLVNNPGENIVDSTAEGSGAAGDLGFNARIVNTRTDLGLTDGDNVGVVDSTIFVGAFTDGTQGYQFQDTDDLMIVEFDPVSILIPTKFEIDYFLTSVGYEVTNGVNDSLRIFLTIDGSTIVPIIDTTGSDIDDLDIEGRWIRGMADLNGLGASAVLTVAVDIDAPNEQIFIDRVVFTAVPEPASAALVLLGSAALAGLRRRRQS